MTVGHVDCTAADNVNQELCEENEIVGVPTIIVYKEGVKVRETSAAIVTLVYDDQAGEYTGKREIKDLMDFSQKYLHKEETEEEEEVAVD